ncbi:unnamed protein product [Merluccius merluccius]
METQRGPSLLLAWSAVLLCAVGSATPTPAPTSGPDVGGGGGGGSAPAVHAHAHNQTRIGDGFNVVNGGGHAPIKTKEEGSGLIAPDPSSAVGSGRRSRRSRRRRRMSSGGPGGWTTGQEEVGASAAASSSLCGYRVIEGGVGGPLCFRRTQLGFRCGRGNCRTVGSPGGLVAHVLTNGSVLLQWTHEGVMTTTTGHHDPDVNETKIGDGRNASGDSAMGWTKGPRGRAGFELSCWWNGSYTQFECAGVHLGPGCRDYVLTELHENVPYRVCLRALGVAGTTTHWGGPPPGDRRDCADFTVTSSGMQDIVIAMTTVGGAICVMLVIICLLVAYITENIMSPATQQQQQHAYSYHTHSRH